MTFILGGYFLIGPVGPVAPVSTPSCASACRRWPRPHHWRWSAQGTALARPAGFESHPARDCESVGRPYLDPLPVGPGPFPGSRPAGPALIFSVLGRRGAQLSHQRFKRQRQMSRADVHQDRAADDRVKAIRASLGEWSSQLGQHALAKAAAQAWVREQGLLTHRLVGLDTKGVEPQLQHGCKVAPRPRAHIQHAGPLRQRTFDVRQQGAAPCFRGG